MGRFGFINRAAIIRALDIYGQPDKEDVPGPDSRSKSLAGAILGTLFRIVALVLIIFNLLRLLQFNVNTIDGNPIIFNSRGIAPNNYGFGPPQYPQMDFPPIALKVNHGITYYEKEVPILQQIAVEDVSGYNVGYSTTEIDERVTKARAGVTRTLSQHLNSFDSRYFNFTGLEGFESTTRYTITSIEDFDAPYRFSEETLKAIYFNDGVFNLDTKFFPQSASAYFRLDQQDLARLKSCQLQVGFENVGLAHLYSDPKLYEERMKYLNTSSFTWAESSFDEDNRRWGPSVSDFVNMVKLSSRLEQLPLHAIGSGVPELEYNDWFFSLSYVNNFNYTFEEEFCGGRQQVKNKVTDFNKTMAAALAVDETATVLELTGRLLSHSNTSLFSKGFERVQCVFAKPGQKVSQPPPATTLQVCELDTWILVSSVWGQEKMKVTEINMPGTNAISQFIRVKRPNPINHKNPLPPARSSQLPGPGWTCPDHYYNKADGCHCGCGEPDPDCTILTSPTLGCVGNQRCSYAALCTTMNFTGVGLMSVSESCSEVMHAGESRLVGYMGTPERFAEESGGRCRACPYDYMYDESPAVDSDGNVWCNFSPQGVIDPSRQAFFNFTDPITLAERAETPRPTLPPPDPLVLEEYMRTLSIRLVVTVLDPTGFPVFSNPKTEFFSGTRHKFGYVPSVRVNSGSDTMLMALVGGEQKLGRLQTISLKPHHNTELSMIQLFDHISRGYLMSAITRASTRILVAMSRITIENHPNFVFVDGFKLKFPTLGPYTIVLAGQPLQVISASQVTMIPNMDTFFLDLPQPPRFSAGFVWPLDQDYDPPDPALNISNTNLPGWWIRIKVKPGTQTPSDFNDVDLLVGLASSDAEKAAVTHAQFDPNSNGKVMILYLERPLTATHDAGTIVEIGALGSQPWLEVTRLTEVKLERNEQPYRPSDRWKGTTQEPFESPSPMGIRAGMFAVPDGKPFVASGGDEAVNLCPNVQIPSVYEPRELFSDWKIMDGRDMTIQDCSFSAFDISQCKNTSELPRGKYRRSCIPDMPPTYQSSFTTVMPITQKWDLSNIAANNAVTQFPEYQFDFMTTFTFQDTPELRSETLEFSSNADTTAIDTQGITRMFTGALDIKGQGAGKGELPSLLPASSPYLKIDCELAKLGNDSIAADWEANLPLMWPTASDDVLSLIEGVFPPLKIDWELDSVEGSTENQTLVLQPGWEYQLYATVQLVPVYADDLLGNYLLFGYSNNVVTTGAGRYKLDMLQSQNMKVRYRINFVPGVKQRMLQLDYTLVDFLTGIGACVAYIGFGFAVLSFWQNKIYKRYWRVGPGACDADFPDGRPQDEEQDSGGGGTVDAKKPVNNSSPNVNIPMGTILASDVVVNVTDPSTVSENCVYETPMELLQHLAHAGAIDDTERGMIISQLFGENAPELQQAFAHYRQSQPSVLSESQFLKAARRMLWRFNHARRDVFNQEMKERTNGVWPRVCTRALLEG